MKAVSSCHQPSSIVWATRGALKETSSLWHYRLFIAELDTVLHVHVSWDNKQAQAVAPVFHLNNGHVRFQVLLRHKKENQEKHNLATQVSWRAMYRRYLLLYCGRTICSFSSMLWITATLESTSGVENEWGMKLSAPRPQLVSILRALTTTDHSTTAPHFIVQAVTGTATHATHLASYKV